MSGNKHYKNDYIDQSINKILSRTLYPDETGISEEERQKRIKDNDLNDFLIRSLRNARGDIIAEDLNPEGEIEYFGPRQDDFGSRRDRRWGLLDENGFYDPTVRENLYNSRGEMQSGLGKISNGVVKAVTTTATTIGRTAGMVWGIPSALINWDAAEIFNNDITKAMDAVDEAMERWLPTYRSFKEENGNWLERNMSAAGISDFIKNWGFTIGSVITGNIAGLAMKGVRNAALKKMVPLLVSTMGEASMEAAQVMNDMMEPAMDVENTRYQAELADIASKYKNNPEYGPEVYDQLILEANDRHQKELDRIYDRSRAAGLWTMGLNNVVLSISNNMLFGAVLKGDAPLERVLQNGINRRFKRLVGDDMRRAITDEEKKKLIGGGAKRLLGAIKTGFSEGGEELSQKYISNAFTNYYNSVLGEDIGRILTEKKEGGGEFDDIINDYYGSMYDDGSVKEADGLWRSLWMTLGETLTDRQSWDEFTAGAAMGLLGMPTFGRRANSGASTWIGRGGVVGWSGGVAGNIRENRMDAARNSAIISQYNDFVNTYRKGPKGDQLDEAIRHIVGGITSDRKSEAMLDLMRNAGTLTQEQEGAIRNEYDRQMHEVISHAVAAYQSVGMLKQLKASVDDMKDDPAGFASDIYANAIVEEDDGNGGKVKRNIYDDITWKGKNGKSVSGQDALTELVRDRATELHNEIEFFEKVRGHLDEKYGHIMSDKSLRDMTFLYSQVHFMEGNSLDEIDRMVEGGRLADVMRTASSHSMTKLQERLKSIDEKIEKNEAEREAVTRKHDENMSRLNDERKVLEDKLKKADDELDKVQADKKSAHDEYTDARKSILERRLALEQQRDRTEEEIKSVEKRIAELKDADESGRKGELQTELQNKRSELETNKDYLDGITKELKRLESEKTARDNELGDRLSIAAKKRTDAERKLNSIESEIGALNRRIGEKNVTYEGHSKALADERDGLNKNIASTTETIEKLNDALDFLRGFGQRGADATRADYRIERLRLADEEKSAKDNLENVEKYIAALKTIAETDTSKIPDNEAGDVLRIKNMANTALANLNTVKHYLENLQRLQEKPEQMEMDEKLFTQKRDERIKKRVSKRFRDDIAAAQTASDVRDIVAREQERRDRDKVTAEMSFDIDQVLNEAANDNDRVRNYLEIQKAEQQLTLLLRNKGQTVEAMMVSTVAQTADSVDGLTDITNYEELTRQYPNAKELNGHLSEAFGKYEDVASLPDIPTKEEAERLAEKSEKNEAEIRKTHSEPQKTSEEQKSPEDSGPIQGAAGRKSAKSSDSLHEGQNRRRSRNSRKPKDKDIAEARQKIRSDSLFKSFIDAGVAHVAEFESKHNGNIRKGFEELVGMVNSATDENGNFRPKVWRELLLEELLNAMERKYGRFDWMDEMDIDALTTIPENAGVEDMIMTEDMATSIAANNRNNAAQARVIKEITERFERIGIRLVTLDGDEFAARYGKSHNGTDMSRIDGTVYGFVEPDGTIVLNAALVTPNSLIHEYTHLWARAMQKMNPQLWSSTKETLRKDKDAKKVWNKVKNDKNYARISDNEDAIASEVIARITGEIGEKELVGISAKDGRKNIQKEFNKSIVEKLKEFWNWVEENIFGLQRSFFEFKSLEEVRTKVLYDLLNETKLPDEVLNGKKEVQEGGEKVNASEKDIKEVFEKYKGVFANAFEKAVKDVSDSDAAKEYIDTITARTITPVVPQNKAQGGKWTTERYNDKDHGEVIGFLDECGSHDYVNGGMLKQGDKVMLCIIPGHNMIADSIDQRTGQVIGQKEFPIIWIVTADEVENANNGRYSELLGGHQLLNVLDQTNAKGDRAKLIEKVREGYSKGMSETFFYEDKVFEVNGVFGSTIPNESPYKGKSEKEIVESEAEVVERTRLDNPNIGLRKNEKGDWCFEFEGRLAMPDVYIENGIANCNSVSDEEGNSIDVRLDSRVHFPAREKFTYKKKKEEKRSGALSRESNRAFLMLPRPDGMYDMSIEVRTVNRLNFTENMKEKMRSDGFMKGMLSHFLKIQYWHVRERGKAPSLMLSNLFMFNSEDQDRVGFIYRKHGKVWLLRRGIKEILDTEKVDEPSEEILEKYVVASVEDTHDYNTVDFGTLAQGILDFMAEHSNPPRLDARLFTPTRRVYELDNNGNRKTDENGKEIYHEEFAGDNMLLNGLNAGQRRFLMRMWLNSLIDMGVAYCPSAIPGHLRNENTQFYATISDNNYVREKDSEKMRKEQDAKDGHSVQTNNYSSVQGQLDAKRDNTSVENRPVNPEMPDRRPDRADEGGQQNAPMPDEEDMPRQGVDEGKFYSEEMIVSNTSAERPELPFVPQHNTEAYSSLVESYKNEAAGENSGREAMTYDTLSEEQRTGLARKGIPRNDFDRVDRKTKELMLWCL